MEDSPTRIAAQVASGIGFLGAGVILREGLSVRGLNTAATLWCSAAVGSLAGLGLTGAAILITGAVILTNLALRPLGQVLDRKVVNSSELEVVSCQSAGAGGAGPILPRQTRRRDLVLFGPAT